ncbi:serine/threonine-protein kinase pim-3 [Polypterus senegalus]|uniref:serine/threonine-protein kinase pim-3 n=1 Tax=Polypterus senegalus TaxID=55291 RepID=UPI0019662568|nr:serine/threonine-protein kinase pim-3 [Polypterus senegalus]
MPTEQVKVINFSYALFLEPEEGTRSAGFYAPLGCFLQDRRQTVPLTVKTLGVLLYEMLCGALTFGRELEIMHNIFTCERKLSIECKELIQWCLKPFPNERPSLEEIIIHPFVSFCHLYQKLS